jgi:hypothetical protein
VSLQRVARCRCPGPICCGQCSMSAASRRNRSIDRRVINPRGWSDTPARRRPRCKRRNLSGWRWRRFSWPDGWPSSAQQLHMHNRFMPTLHRHSHRRPSTHRLHTLCLNRQRPRFHQDYQAPFRDPRWSRLRAEIPPTRSLALIRGRLQRRGHPTSRKRTKADKALGLTVGTGAVEVTPPIVRVFGQHVDSHFRPMLGECAAHSKPRTDVTPSGLFVRTAADAS